MGWFRGTRQDGQEPALSFEERLALVRPGVPGRCPECEGLGYIDSIDIGHRYQIQHCKDCLHRWEYLFDGDGVVVGLTELDPSGKPVARSRVRPLRAAPAATTPDPDPDPDPETAPADDEVEVVVDLRDSEAAEPEVADATGAEHLSPAEWLRRSAHRS
jgi:hypothetical protein